MTMYSVIPEEEIFKGSGEENYRFVDMTLEGIPLQVQLMGDSHAKIVRLYSTNPNDYLNPRLAPGTVIRFTPAIVPDTRGSSVPGF